MLNETPTGTSRRNAFQTARLFLKTVINNKKYIVSFDGSRTTLITLPICGKRMFRVQ